MQLEEYFDTDLFLDLPLEIQQQVILERPDLLKMFSRVNYDYHELLERSMVNEFCNQPISEHEFLYIEDFQPIRGTLYKKFIGKNVNNLLIIDQSNLINGKKTTMIEIIVDDPIHIQTIPPQLHQAKKEYYHDDLVFYDYLSLYNIWTNRINCMKDSNYAKSRTLSRLDNQEKVYAVNKNRKMNLDYKNFISCIYISLIMNKYIFNIIDPSKITKLMDIEANIDDIKHDIEYLFKTLREIIKVM